MVTIEEQVEELLKPPTSSAVTEFFAQITTSLPVEVRPDAGDGRGKGLFATRAIPAGALLFQEPPLVAIQHMYTAQNVACAHCFAIIGSIEDQLASTWNSMQSPAALKRRQDQSALLPKLPLSEEFPLPPKTYCYNGPCCPAKYCSEECRSAAWSSHHRLLCPCLETCTGGGDSSNTAVGNSNYTTTNTNTTTTSAPVDPFFEEFYSHADITNDIFVLAAQAIATVLTRAQKELDKSCISIQEAKTNPEVCWSALQTAWTPFKMGHKALWWECVAKPDDISELDEPRFRADIKELADDSLGLLTTALTRRRPSLCSLFPTLFHPHLWGSLIGMFELNNLTLLVSSPVPLWAQAVDDIKEGLRADQRKGLASYEAIDSYEGLDGIIESEGEFVVTGNAFYSLQACINHDCQPNAQAWKREEDINGSAVILALSDIAPGDEITICYVDREDDLKKREHELREYGFLCECERCSAERLASELAHTYVI